MDKKKDKVTGHPQILENPWRESSVKYLDLYVYISCVNCKEIQLIDGLIYAPLTYSYTGVKRHSNAFCNQWTV